MNRSRHSSESEIRNPRKPIEVTSAFCIKPIIPSASSSVFAAIGTRSRSYTAPASSALAMNVKLKEPLGFATNIRGTEPMPRDSETSAAIPAGGALFAKLKALGVDHVFVNSGTDFPPIIEGLIDARNRGIELPTAITVPHEHVALGMAHGYYLVSGRPQAVMLHTNVGLSNGATGAINAACDQIPMFLMSGRTPVLEGGRFGARTVPIGWGQEMYDQSALVREACKWDYELRFPDHLAQALDRGWAIANSTPKGPVYLSLPREVLCEPCPDNAGITAPPAMAPAVCQPCKGEIERASQLLADAKRPLIIAPAGGRVARRVRGTDQFRRTMGNSGLSLLGQPDCDPEFESGSCRLAARRPTARGRCGSRHQCSGPLVAGSSGPGR